MKIKQIYTNCLAQGAYYITSGKEAAIIDPLREVQPYIDQAEKDGVKIKYIFETHFHADFVSGHLTLAEKTGASIIYGPSAEPGFDAHIAQDGENFDLGNTKIEVLHTPGHTLESTTYLLKDEEGNDHAIFTGDTLFLGDVGRPDLAQESLGISKEELAGKLFESLRNKIMPLPDEVLVYPGHGAGSACGKNMMSKTVDTLGNQKLVNYALRKSMSKEEFIEEVLEGLTAPPDYFSMNVKMNMNGYESIDSVLEKGLKPLSAHALEELANVSNAIILDVRSKEEFAKEHIPNSIFIGLDGDFALWVGTLLKDVDQEILLVVPEGREEEAVTRLARVGFDNVLGYLKGGVHSWKRSGKETDSISQMGSAGLIEKLESAKIFDLRNKREFDSSHLENAFHSPLEYINDYMEAFPKEGEFYVHCAGGYRSLIGASILKGRGYNNVVDIIGGYQTIQQHSLPFKGAGCQVGQVENI